MTATTVNVAKDPNERFNVFFKTVTKNLNIWLLIDEHGSVLLSADDEDCVPVWPTEEHAMQWATGEWKGFTSESISTSKWKSRWTSGLEDDELSVIIFPDQQCEGIVLYPDEFEQELEKFAIKQKN